VKTIDIYYNKEKECIQLVGNGIVKFHDEAINSSEFLSYFDDDMREVEGLKDLTLDEITEGYDCMLADYKQNCGEKAVEEYFNNVAQQEIQGELICSFKIKE
jgi:hypothetical protein